MNLSDRVINIDIICTYSIWLRNVTSMQVNRVFILSIILHKKNIRAFRHNQRYLKRKNVICIHIHVHTARCRVSRAYNVTSKIHPLQAYTARPSSETELSCDFQNVTLWVGPINDSKMTKSDTCEACYVHRTYIFVISVFFDVILLHWYRSASSFVSSI